VLSESAHFFYKCDNYYNKESEGGINYKDSFLNIDWEIPFEEIQVSEKDENLPNFKSII
ncbi:dTDP-4-dehydrorhamnose 3,5-epimerase family protein, partial [Muricauda sp. AC10]|nr:dTDP-4-dehydrorhamnose 3,5-epimerase family protein [Muricauda sp. AC10]